MSVGIVEVDNEERYIHGSTGNIAEVDSVGNLHVINPAPLPPSGSTPVILTLYYDVNGNNEYTIDYTIPINKTLYCQKLIGSSEDLNKDTKKQLITADNLNWINEITIVLDFAQDVNFDLNDIIIGNGNKILGLRVQRMDNGKRECFLKFYGYLKDTV